MFKTMKQAFGWAVGYVLGLAAMKFVGEVISNGFSKETKDESADD